MGLLYKLAYLAQTKTDIRQALQTQGSDVTESDTFRSYADFVSEISGGNLGGEVKLIFSGTSSNVAGKLESL